MCHTVFSVFDMPIYSFSTETKKVTIFLQKLAFWHFCCEMTGVNKKPVTYLYLHQFNLETNSNNENAISKMSFVECI